MPQTIEITVYEFDELSPQAQEKARDWYRELIDADDYDSVIEDFTNICEIFGITLQTRPVRLYGGGTRDDPCIWWSGFASQGDGACFEGRYSYKTGFRAALKEYAPKDLRLQEIARRLTALQSRHFYKLTSTMTHSGRYSHSGCMEVTTLDRDGYEVEYELGRDMQSIFRALADWLYRQLEAENDWLMSEESVDENIRANCYTFTAEGKRFG